MLLVNNKPLFRLLFCLDTDDGCIEALPEDARVGDTFIAYNGVHIPCKAIEGNWVCKPLDLAFINGNVYYNGVLAVNTYKEVFWSYVGGSEVLELYSTELQEPLLIINFRFKRLISYLCELQKCTLKRFMMEANYG